MIYAESTQEEQRQRPRQRGRSAGTVQSGADVSTYSLRARVAGNFFTNGRNQKRYVRPAWARETSWRALAPTGPSDICGISTATRPNSRQSRISGLACHAP